MDSKQLFDAGDLAGALQSVTQQVRGRPADATARTFLFELLCFAGELDRAEKQLAAIGQQAAQSEWGVQVYGNILNAERRRRQVFSSSGQPEFLLDPPQYIAEHLAALKCACDGNPGAAAELLARASETRPTISARCGEQAVDEFRDCDDLLAPVLELMVLHDYIWVPLEQVRELEIARPERPRDLIWPSVRLVLSDNSPRRGYMPALYAGTHLHVEDQVKLGRQTDWQTAGDGPARGVGLRTFLVGDEALGLFELNKLQLSVRP
jgi:type VI secretion system protein ImpE